MTDPTHHTVPVPTEQPDTGLFANTTGRKVPANRSTTPDPDGPALFAGRRPAKRTPPREPQPRWRDEDMPLRPGDVLAVGLNNGRCPVGQITGVNDFYIRLTLYSWPLGRFTAGTVVIRHEQVCEFSTLAVQGDGGVYQMEPLRQFQTAWTEVQQ